MQKIGWSSLLALLAFANILQAEIEQIEIRWNAFKCLDTCVPLIERNLKTIKNVTNIQTDSRSGTAVLGWVPHSPFSYEPFKLASSTAGIRFDEIRLRVSGTIMRQGDNFYLISSGDHTQFLLLGQPPIKPGHSTPKYYLAARPLAPEVKNQLLEAENKHYPVVILGPLNLPNRYPLTLIAEKIQLYVKEN